MLLWLYHGTFQQQGIEDLLTRQIMVIDVVGTNKVVIKKQEWIVVDYKKELELEENYTN